MAKITLKDSGRMLAKDAEVAVTFMRRLIGLLGKTEVASNYVLVFFNTASIHMFFMRCPIDVVYLNNDFKIIKLVRNLRPWRMSACWRAKVTIEAGVGFIDTNELRIGHFLKIDK